MDIYLDSLGLAKYLKELMRRIRRDSATDSKNVFNISRVVWDTNTVFTRQNLFITDIDLVNLSSLQDEQGRELSEKDVDFQSGTKSNRGKITKDQILKSIGSYVSMDDELKSFIDIWITDGSAPIYPISASAYSSFRQECSISIKKDNTPFCGNNSKSSINIDNILNGLRNIFFVSETEISLNKTFFTRELGDWRKIGLSLINEKDIIIVDPYFFQSLGGKFGENEKIFIEEICGGGELNKHIRNIVIFFKNCVCAEWLSRISADLKNKLNCNITYIGVTDSHALHDRFIVSNFRFIFSGHSFAQFFNNGSFCANGSIGITVGSIADNSNQVVMEKALEYLQSSILDKKENYYVYGDVLSNLLKIGDDVITPQSIVLEQYPIGTEVVLEQDGEEWHWGTDFLIRSNKKVDYKNKSVRLCNIKKNKKINSPYKWLAYAYIISN